MTAGPIANDRPLEARWPMPMPIDLQLTMAALRHGSFDPTMRIGRDGVWLARRTAAGPATLRIWIVTDEAAVSAQAWGPGAESALEAAPGLAGLLDDPTALIAAHPIVRELQRRHIGLRLPRSGQLMPALVPAITAQKVTAEQAHDAYGALARRYGEPAPGPAGLSLPPDPARLAALPYFEFHPVGLERRRAEVIIRVARQAAAIEALAGLEADAAFARLVAIPGIGPWTAAETTGRAFGDPDAVSVGDAHLPHMVSWALAREPRGDDARMLELLEPYRGQRGRVLRLLKVSGITAPRYGPRFSPQRIEGI